MEDWLIDRYIGELTEDLPMPDGDRRCRRNWLKATMIKARTRFIVEVIDPKKYFNDVNVKAGPITRLRSLSDPYCNWGFIHSSKAAAQVFKHLVRREASSVVDTLRVQCDISVQSCGVTLMNLLQHLVDTGQLSMHQLVTGVEEMRKKNKED